jgi:hypothetical protein
VTCPACQTMLGAGSWMLDSGCWVSDFWFMVGFR